MTAISRVPATPAVASATAPADASPVTTIAATLSAKPPVDADRVRQIRAAIADGTFPITPDRIADRLIALRSEWIANDAA